jgi:hypothetical protein
MWIRDINVCGFACKVPVTFIRFEPSIKRSTDLSENSWGSPSICCSVWACRWINMTQQIVAFHSHFVYMPQNAKIHGILCTCLRMLKYMVFWRGFTRILIWSCYTSLTKPLRTLQQPTLSVDHLNVEVFRSHTVRQKHLVPVSSWLHRLLPAQHTTYLMDRQTNMLSAEFKPTIPANRQLLVHTVDCVAIGFSWCTQYFLNLAVRTTLDTYRVKLAFVPVNVTCDLALTAAEDTNVCAEQLACL